MKIYKAKCPNCMGEIRIDNRKIECAYCGSQFFAEDLIVEEELNTKKRKQFSGLSIWALITSCLWWYFAVGIILGIIDLSKKDYTKNHLLSKVAIAFNTFLLVIGGIYYLGPFSPFRGFQLYESEYVKPIVVEDNLLYYSDDASFESDLNAGKNLENTYVTFLINDVQEESAFGYDLWAGEHLNFVSRKNPNLSKGQVITVKARRIKKTLMTSYLIEYEFIKEGYLVDTQLE